MRGKKGKTIKPSKKEAVFEESQIMVLLENIRDDIKVIAETQSATIKELRGFKIETRDNFKAVFEYQSRFSDEVYERFEQIDKRFEQVDKRFEQIDKRFEQVDDNFELVFERLSKIENELAEIKKELKKIDKNKISAEKFNLLEKRVAKLERKLEKYKVSAKVRV